MRAVCNTETFGKKLALVSRGVSARSTIQLLGGILLEAGTAWSGYRRRTWRSRSRRCHRRRSRRRGGSSYRPGSSTTSCGRFRVGSFSLEHDDSGGRSGWRPGRTSTASGRMRPTTSRSCPGSTPRPHSNVRGLARRDRREGVAVLLAGRDEAGLDGDPHQLRGEQGEDGDDGLLPPQHQGDGAGDYRVRGLEGGDHTGAGDAGGRSHLRLRGGRRGRGLALREPGALQDRGRPFGTRLIDGNFPEYRRLLPTTFEREISVNRGKPDGHSTARQPLRPAPDAAGPGKPVHSRRARSR